MVETKKEGSGKKELTEGEEMLRAGEQEFSHGQYLGLVLLSERNGKGKQEEEEEKESGASCG